MKLATQAQIDLANKVVLKNPNLNIIPDSDDYPWFIRRFQFQLQEMEKRGDLLLPNLHFGNESIAIFSDYGGDHKETPYLVYSFLICAGDALTPFEQAMQIVREKHKLNDPIREIQFKN